MGETPHYLLEVVEVEAKGRGVIVLEKVPMAAFVCEYEGVTYPRRDRAAHEAEYAKNGEFWMC